MSAPSKITTASTLPLAYNTRNGKPLKGAGVFRDANNQWWSIQGRGHHDGHGHISFVRLKHRPEWLTGNDISNAVIAVQLQMMFNSGNIRTFRSQDEADEAFKEAHAERRTFL